MLARALDEYNAKKGQFKAINLLQPFLMLWKPCK